MCCIVLLSFKGLCPWTKGPWKISKYNSQWFPLLIDTLKLAITPSATSENKQSCKTQRNHKALSGPSLKQKNKENVTK